MKRRAIVLAVIAALVTASYGAFVLGYLSATATVDANEGNP